MLLAPAWRRPAPRRRWPPWWISTGRSGVKRSASFFQLPTTDIGQMSSVGRLVPIALPARAGSGPASGWSCPAPCRRPGRRPGPSGAGRPARSSRAPGRAAASPESRPAADSSSKGSCAFELVEELADPAVGRDAAEGQAARGFGGSQGHLHHLADRGLDRFPSLSRSARAAWISSAMTCTHWPRTRTSGALSAARAASSCSVSISSPRATCQSKLTICVERQPTSRPAFWGT